MRRLFLIIAFLILTSLWVGHRPLLGNRGYVNRLGIPLPPDAAPPAAQVLVLFTGDNHYMEWFKTAYKVASPGVFLISEPLVRVDHNFDLLPAAAERWDVSPDGLTWTFHIRRGMVWSDGAPLNAHDYV